MLLQQKKNAELKLNISLELSVKCICFIYSVIRSQLQSIYLLLWKLSHCMEPSFWPLKECSLCLSRFSDLNTWCMTWLILASGYGCKFDVQLRMNNWVVLPASNPTWFSMSGDLPGVDVQAAWREDQVWGQRSLRHLVSCQNSSSAMLQCTCCCVCLPQSNYLVHSLLETVASLEVPHFWLTWHGQPIRALPHQCTQLVAAPGLLLCDGMTVSQALRGSRGDCSDAHFASFSDSVVETVASVAKLANLFQHKSSDWFDTKHCTL